MNRLRLLHSAWICCVFLGLNVFSYSAQGAKPKSAWTVSESANFRLFSLAAVPHRGTLTADFESLRQRLFAYWVESESPSIWTPKCDVVLHETDASYLAAVGSQGGSTVASSLVDDQHGKIVVRRIDVRASRGDWSRSAFPHELTHVVLADRFAGKTLPRWADEGMAILADPVDKQARHWEDLQTAITRRQSFRIMELMELRDYPTANRWGAFYGQSASLVSFLVERDSPKTFLDFVDVCDKRGSAAALKSVYQIESTAACELAWRQSLKGKPRSLAQCGCGPKIALDRDQRTVPESHPAQETKAGQELLVSQ